MTPIYLKASRDKLGLTQKALSELLGLSLPQYQKLEQGDSKIKKIHVLALRWVAYSEFSILLPAEYQDDFKFTGC